jgi:hypothetical protein
VWHLAVHVLGFSSTLIMRDIKVKLTRAIRRLVELEIVELPIGVDSVQDLFTKKGTGSYAVTLQRGAYFTRGPARRTAAAADTESPLIEPLRAIGFDDQATARILRTYRRPLVQVWADITLAAMESKKDGFFTRSPQAYFTDNLKAATAGRRTPPDWWRSLKKARDQAIYQVASHAFTDDSEVFRAGWEKARRDAFHDQRVMELQELYSATLPQQEAAEEAIAEAERHFQSGFEFPDFSSWLADQRPRDAA